MKNLTRHKIFRSAIGLLAAIVLYLSAGLQVPVLDPETDTYFKTAITEAGLAYATCRVINASVSVIKESDLELGPMGVGISLAVGQVLDPIDDMTERLSDVLVTAITSLGVQKLAYEISVALAPSLLAVLVLVLSVLIWFENEGLAAIQKNVVRLTLLIAVARFCLPVSSLANDYLYRHYFAGEIEAAKQELSTGSAEFDKLKDWNLPEADGVMGTIENNAAFLRQKSSEMRDSFGVIVSNMGMIVENLLKLTFLYVGLFIIQVLALPLLAFWFLAKLAMTDFHPVRVQPGSSQPLRETPSRVM